MEIYEESLATGVLFIEEFVVAGLVCGDRIRTVHRFIRVESGREILYIVEAQEKSEQDNRSESEEHGRDEAPLCGHKKMLIVCFVSLVIKL